MSGPALRARSNAAGIGSRLAGRLAGYAPLPGMADELLDHNGHPRAAWLRFFEQADGLSDEDIGRRFASAERHIRDTGVSYRIYGESTERAWPLGSLPLLIDPDEWATIADGVLQRAALLEAVLQDVYGEGRLVRDGILPAAAVAGSPEFLRPLHGVAPRGGRYLHLYAADLGRFPDGSWRVLADRTQAPSGAGYALENRLVLSRAFPELYRSIGAERLAPFFQAFREGLAKAAERQAPRICLLTSGPYSNTYFEQAYLARYLGFLLVEGDDLIIRDGHLHVRTVAGLKRADVVWRRVDADSVDPLELDPASRLGVPGLVETLRNGGLVVGNMPGSGLVEAGALTAYLPQLCAQLRGEDLRLAGLETWWCGEAAGRAHVLNRLTELNVMPAFSAVWGSVGAGRGGAPSPTLALDRLAAAIHDRPTDYVGQEPTRLSTTPVWRGGRLVPRPFVLRVFAAATPDGWQVMPGGFCRISDDPDALPLAMGAGVSSADVWVPSAGPVSTVSLLPRRNEVAVRRISGHLPSRAADNLFWLGRYLERAEAVIRLVRCLLDGPEPALATDPRTAARLTGLLQRWGCVDGSDLGPVGTARDAMSGGEELASALTHVRSASRAAANLRERLSPETWRTLTGLSATLADETAAEPSIADLVTRADDALASLAALSGLAQENMNRVSGWHFVDMGRRIERGINTCAFARIFAEAAATTDDLGVLLDLVDSQIPYGARYILGVSLAPVRDMVVLDPFNPRSVAFQVASVIAHLAELPEVRADGLPETQRRLATSLSAEISSAEASTLDRTSITVLEDKLKTLADAISARYFPGGPDAVRPEKLTGLA